MSIETKSSRGLEKFTKTLVSRARRIRSAVDKRVLDCAVSSWEEYVNSEEFGLNHAREGVSNYYDVTDSLKNWLFGYTREQGFNPEQLFQY